MEGLTAGVYRLRLEARDGATLPADKGTMLRGGFGVALKRSVCAYRDPAVRLCTICPLRAACVYPRLFEGDRPTGHNDAGEREHEIPRPFIFRIPPDHRARYQPGQTLEIEFVLIGWARAYLPYVTLALSDLAEGGMGRERARFAVREVLSIDPFGRPPLRLDVGRDDVPPYVVDWLALRQRAALLPSDGLTLSFITPTRIVVDHRPLPRPALPVLVSALRRRAELLLLHHCGTPWRMDMAALDEAIAHVRASDTRLHWVERSRRSTRTERTMPMGGVVGHMRLEGAIMPLRPLLAFGEVLHVGKLAAFGYGQVACTSEQPPTSGVARAPDNAIAEQARCAPRQEKRAHLTANSSETRKEAAS